MKLFTKLIPLQCYQHTVLDSTASRGSGKIKLAVDFHDMWT